MVRLKDAENWQAKFKSLGFQFQYGTIKRLAPVISILAALIFQFQYGTIKSLVQIENVREFMAISIPVWYD